MKNTACKIAVLLIFTLFLFISCKKNPPAAPALDLTPSPQMTSTETQVFSPTITPTCTNTPADTATFTATSTATPAVSATSTSTATATMVITTVCSGVLGSTSAPNQSFSADYFILNAFTISDTENIRQFNANCYPGAFRVFIYENNGGAPGSIIADSGLLNSAVNDWAVYDFPETTLLPGSYFTGLISPIGAKCTVGHSGGFYGNDTSYTSAGMPATLSGLTSYSVDPALYFVGCH